MVNPSEANHGMLMHMAFIVSCDSTVPSSKDMGINAELNIKTPRHNMNKKFGCDTITTRTDRFRMVQTTMHKVKNAEIPKKINPRICRLPI
jgi:hypothetical protein